MTAPERRVVPLVLDTAALEARTRNGQAFSNGTEWEIWSYRWCGTCSHEDSGGDVFCPLTDLALLADKTPSEWGDPETGTDGRYRCSQYQPARDGVDVRTA
jgi:hypothetical protein